MILVNRQEYKDKSKDEILDDLEDALNELDRVKRELRKYKNPNTPPSAHPHLKPNTQSAGKLGKRGAPKGHKGTTRIQTPDSLDKHDMGECPNCHGNNLRDKKVHTRIIEEIPEPVQPKTTLHEVHEKECLDCGLVFALATEVPRQGKFGINMMVLVIFLRFILRGVLRKSASFLDTH